MGTKAILTGSLILAYGLTYMGMGTDVQIRVLWRSSATGQCARGGAGEPGDLATIGPMTEPLILKRASASRSLGQCRDDDYDVFEKRSWWVASSSRRSGPSGRS